MAYRRKYHIGLDWRPTPIIWPPRVASGVYEMERQAAVARFRPVIWFGVTGRRMRLFNKQNGECFWCFGKMSLEPMVVSAVSGRLKPNSAYASFEHLRRKRDGGTFTTGNIVLAHSGCNNKRDKKRYPHDPFPIWIEDPIARYG